MTALFYLYGSETLALILAPHNWAQKLNVELSLPTDFNRPLESTIESRRAFAANARYSLGYRVLLEDAQAPTELRIFLKRLKNETVAVPMWADWIELSQARSAGNTSSTKTSVMPVRYGSEWIVLAPDASVFEIVTVSAVSSSTINFSALANARPSGTRMYPLIFGRLTEFPKAESITDEAIDAPLKIKENSAFARRLSTPTQTPRLVGSNISAFSGVTLWDIAPNWEQVLDSTQADVQWSSVGYQREEQSLVFPGENASTNEFGYLQQGRDQILRIEWIWRDRRGPVRPFFYPTYRGDMVLATNANVGASSLTVEPTEFTNPARPAQPGDPYIALVDPDGSVDPYKLGVVSGTTLNISGTTVGTQHLVGQARLSHLLYGRLGEPKLTWTYETDALASTRIKFAELPGDLEYFNANGSLPAALAEPGYLFIFTEKLTSPIVSRFTSYENSITISGTYAGTYPPAPYSFENLRGGLRMDEEITLHSAKFTGNPLGKFYPFAFDGELTVLVLEVNAANLATAPEVVFYGDVLDVDPTTYETKCGFLQKFFGRKYPNWLLGRVDNTSPDLTAFGVAGTINTTLPSTSQTLNIASVPGNAKAAQYFAEGGYLDTGTGANLERRGIRYSVPITSPVTGVQIVIDRPLLKAATSQAITLYPGYNGSIDQRDTKFSDRDAFGGHPYMPDTNPMLKAMKAKQVDGGKK